LIRLENTIFGYHHVPVIRCRELAIIPGTCVGIYGANGSGKSTLMRGVAGVLSPMAGRVTRNANLVIALVPQRQAIDPAWPMTAFDAAAMALSSQTALGWLGRRKTAVVQSLESLQVAPLAHRPFKELSGGQQQRVLLAGALACKPQLLLLDEPAEGLDAASTAALLKLLRHQLTLGTALIMISHEAGELAQVAGSFAWVEVAATTHQPNELILLSREEFLRRGIGVHGVAVPADAARLHGANVKLPISVF
jgi:ABC-type Mn2+/Zn2+ transport system ATPase subunit